MELAPPSRRTMLADAAALVVGGLAGCSLDRGLGVAKGENDGVFTAFFTLEDFTQQVTGDAMAVENPIPASEMGHRYEVGNRAQLDAARSVAFVYADIAGFQNWARVTAANLRDRHHKVTVVDALEGVNLREFSGEADDERGDRGGDDDGQQQDRGHREDDKKHDEGPGHDGVDPHYWLDPIRAAESVEVIAKGLAEADPGNAGTYESNAAEYVAELEALHEEFELALADRVLDTVVVAGHDSYQYFAERYDFEIYSPVGVSPNVEPSSSEIAETVEVVDDHDADVVLYDTFGSPTLAETVVRESNASEAVPVSPLEGTKPEWQDRGWGYLGQMKELNLPAFKAALKVE